MIMAARYTRPCVAVEAFGPPRAWQREDSMAERPRFFDDLAGVAGGAFSALTGLRDEAEALVRARVEETIRALDLVRRADLDAVAELAANARAAQEAAEARTLALEARLAALEAKVAALAAKPVATGSEGGGPGMIA
jgi:BMFP domain-containing protein YqiC